MAISFTSFAIIVNSMGAVDRPKRQCFELVGLSLDMKSEVLPGPFLYWNVEVNVLEVYGGYPFSLLERCSDGFRCLHLEFFGLEEKIQIA